MALTSNEMGHTQQGNNAYCQDHEITWFDWSQQDTGLAIALYLDGSDDSDRATDGTPLIDDDFLVLVNACWEPLEFALPATRPQAVWQVEIDTCDPVPSCRPATADRKAGDPITVGPRSVVLLKKPSLREGRPGLPGAGNTPIEAREARL